MQLSHIGQDGFAKMVDVGEKEITHRTAQAEGFVYACAETVARIREGGLKKGDVLAVATVAGINAAKHTWELIPMCHAIPLEGCDISFEFVSDTAIRIFAEVRADYKTGVEMEALTAVSVAALTVYDMTKAIDKRMSIGDIRLVKKTGGKTGDFVR